MITREPVAVFFPQHGRTIAQNGNRLMLKVSFTFVLSCFLALAATSARAQSGVDLPNFEVATIKAPAPGADRRAGFYGEPGGRVFIDGMVWMLVEIAFNLQDYQLTGNREGIASMWFEINAVPPENSASRQITLPNAEPTPEQRLMLQALLRDRFGLKFHFEIKEGEVFIPVAASRSN